MFIMFWVFICGVYSVGKIILVKEVGKWLNLYVEVEVVWKVIMDLNFWWEDFDLKINLLKFEEF